jgi:predicted aspartyl protease
MNNFQALTLTSNGGLLRVLSSSVKVCTPIIDKSKGPDTITDEITGIWDTGASGSVITKDVVDKLGIQPIGMTFVNTASEEKVQTPVYLVDFVLPNGVVIQGLRVTLGKLSNAQVLIGMDIINFGDLTVTNYQQKTIMTFRVPSSGEVDYVKELQASSQATVTDATGTPLSRQQRKQLEKEQFQKWKAENKKSQSQGS